jgi:hypothetical protein
MIASLEVLIGFGRIADGQALRPTVTPGIQGATENRWLSITILD